MMNRKICFVATIEFAVRMFLAEQIRVLSRDFDITVITKPDERQLLKSFGIDVRLIPLVIERKVAPVCDLKALLQLYRILRKEGFQAVHSITPKAGLLCMVAAWGAGVPNRIHTFTGQVWATRRGAKRWFLKSLDRLLSACATRVFTDGPSQRDFLIKEGVVDEKKVQFVAAGSMAGVDVDRFVPDKGARASVRKGLGLGESETLFLYLGRLNREKGLLDLARAFSMVLEEEKGVALLFVGPDEEDMKSQIRAVAGSSAPRIYFENFTEVPEQYMAAADVFCLPSYREGFGAVIIEAASAGTPSLASRIYGITDAVEEGVTGLLHEPGDAEGLAVLMMKMAREPQTRQRMGEEGRRRVIRSFSKDQVVDAFVSFYNRLLGDGTGNEGVLPDAPPQGIER
jgi:glycosyltransferase involved in cell wall biosynthesis